MHILETKSCQQGRRKHMSKFLQADWKDKREVKNGTQSKRSRGGSVCRNKEQMK